MAARRAPPLISARAGATPPGERPRIGAGPPRRPRRRLAGGGRRLRPARVQGPDCDNARPRPAGPRSYRASGKAPFTDFPIAVLVNGLSASASEIVAACLQDNGLRDRRRPAELRQRHRAAGLRPRPRAGAMKFTVATYWRPSGQDINRPKESGKSIPWGVSPNEGYEVPVTDGAAAAAPAMAIRPGGGGGDRREAARQSTRPRAAKGDGVSPEAGAVGPLTRTQARAARFLGACGMDPVARRGDGFDSSRRKKPVDFRLIRRAGRNPTLPPRTKSAGPAYVRPSPTARRSLS